MKFDDYFEIVYERFSNKIRLRSKKDKQLLPVVFDSIDLSYINEPHVSVVKATIDGQMRLYDIKERKVLSYTISKWGGDDCARYITMELRSGNRAIFDTYSKKLFIMPKEVVRTYASTYCKDNYCLVQLTSGEFSFYHILRYFILNVRYSKEELQSVKYGLHWKDVVKRCPQDFKHLPNEFAQNKKVVETCYQIIKEHLQSKKEEMSKEGYIEYRKLIVDTYNARLTVAYPNHKK